MTEFEKWWYNRNRNPLPDDEDDLIEEAWRAALEWVQKENDSLYSVRDLAVTIEKELEND